MRLKFKVIHVILRERKSNPSLICIVESATDVYTIDESTNYRGYFVLQGNLSPIDGRGPSEIGLINLKKLSKKNINELILATSTTIEGEATAHYIKDMASRQNINISH